MRRAATLVSCIALVFACAALLSPPIFFALQRTPLASELTFSRVLSRTLLILALLAMWPLAKQLGLTRNGLGLTRPRMRDVVVGFLIGLFSLGIFVAIALVVNAREIRPSLNGMKLARSLLLAMGAAVIVAPMEEILFRRMCFGALRTRKWIPAMLFSSLLFAVVHFPQTPRDQIPRVTWTSGFDTLAMMFTENANSFFAAAQFLNLTFCGIILCVAFQRTKSLWFSLALHTGWIFWLKFANTITIVPRNAPMIWGTRKVVDAWTVTPLLIVTIVAVELVTRRWHSLHPTPRIEHSPDAPVSP